MKKVLVGLLLLALVLPLFADDGSVLPAGVFRARVIPAYGWAPGSYDSDGKYTTNAEGTITAPNLGFALEYGVIDWITLGLQWAPGVTFASNAPISGLTKTNIDGLSNLFAGVMVQIVGPKALVVSDVVRFDLAPGVKIPLGGADFSKQAQNAMNGSATTVQNADKQALGVGGRAYLDYIFNKSFFLDLYSQFIYYPGKIAAKNYSLSDGYTYFSTGGATNPDVRYGSDLRIELDPHYSTMISDALKFSANCAFRYDATTADSYSDGADIDGTKTALFSANPSVAIFFVKSVVPFELQLDYGQPLYGTTAPATYSLDLQAKVYFKF